MEGRSPLSVRGPGELAVALGGLAGLLAGLAGALVAAGDRQAFFGWLLAGIALGLLGGFASHRLR